ncbi:hypothetical protein X767_03525 [Mesorhizobium sp. LSJC264A00]|nr:hypothetical protein X767_03525 [Mesorhizobium sp. LSJC264A00]
MPEAVPVSDARRKTRMTHGLRSGRRPFFMPVMFSSSRWRPPNARQNYHKLYKNFTRVNI